MNLFDRLPDAVFSPLVGVNRRRTWLILERLHHAFFAGDSVPPYADGWLHEQVVKEIERVLLDVGWEEEGSQISGAATPLSIQANQALARFVDTGWLVEEQTGLKKFVTMRPVVSRFFELLQQFATEGPQLIGGDVLLIHNQLKGVVQDPRTQAGGFVNAALLCVRLIKALSNTTVRVRDLMKELAKETATPVFVRRFFDEHIADLYLRDFKQLRTENHPLRLRFEIIELVNEVTHDDTLRAGLLQGYRDIPGNEPGQETELLERDVQRFRRLLDVEKFLDRMDRVMDAATQRAVAYLSYRLKASERIEEVIRDTIQAAEAAARLNVPIEAQLLVARPLVGDNRLRLPVVPPPKPRRTALTKREMTPHERAMYILRKAMIAHRDTTPATVQRYVERHIIPGASRDAASMPVTTVEEAVAYLVLTRIAGIASRNPAAIRRSRLLRTLDFQVELLEGERADNECFNTPNFRVTRRNADAAQLESDR